MREAKACNRNFPLSVDTCFLIALGDLRSGLIPLKMLEDLLDDLLTLNDSFPSGNHALLDLFQNRHALAPSRSANYLKSRFGK